MERRTLLAFVICIGIWLAWQKFYLEPRAPIPPAGNTAVTTTQGTTQTAPVTQGSAPTNTVSQSNTPSGAGNEVKPAQREQVSPRVETVSTKIGAAKVGNGSVVFEDWNLKGYRLNMAPGAGSVDLRSVVNEAGEVRLGFDKPEFAYLSGVRGNLQRTPGGALVWTYEDDKVRITREVSNTGEQAYVNLNFSVDFKTADRAKYAFVTLSAKSPKDDPEATDRQLYYFSDNSLTSTRVTDVKAEPKNIELPVKWIAAANRYFLLTVVNQGSDAMGQLYQGGEPGSGNINLIYPISSNNFKTSLKAYFGPKELDLLRSVDPTLDHAVDFGWFTAFAYPILKLMKWIYGYVKNYGIAIILLTLVIKLLTYPLTYKSMKGMKEMAKIQPQLQKIREKYKDDKEALNREMLSVMKTHGYNPMAGCLPILIQMPVFFALYRVLYSSIELYQAPFALWIHDLSSKDPFYVTPIVLTVTMYLQQKLTPSTATDPAQQKMLQLMPVIFGVMMITLPAGLTIYMLTNALASIVQQIILNRKLDLKHGAAVPARAR